MAYDHSRVVLDPPEGYEEEFQSDYINASYVSVSRLAFANLTLARSAVLEGHLTYFWKTEKDLKIKVYQHDPIQFLQLIRLKKSKRKNFMFSS